MPERAWWIKRMRTSRAWRVPIEDIVASGYNLDIKNPNTVDLGHEDPDVLLARYKEAEMAVATAREALKITLGQALGQT